MLSDIEKKRWVQGILLMFLVVVLWVGSSILTQVILTKEDYNKPFFVTYVSLSLFSVYLFGFLCCPQWRMKCKSSAGSIENTEPTDPSSSMGYIIKIASMFCPLLFIANYTFNLSLGYTSVSSDTILSSTSSFFTLLLGAFFHTEEFTFFKLIAIFFCIGGVSLVSYRDEIQGTNPLLGDCLALVSAIAYGTYTTFLKKKIPNEKVISMPMFFGFVGFLNILLCFPFMLYLHYFGLEEFMWPSSRVLLGLLINGLMGSVLSDVLWCFVIFFTSPLVATMGLTLTIPFAIISDMYYQKKSFDYIYLIGTALVFLGFIIVNITSKERELQLIHYIKQKIFMSPNNDDQVNISTVEINLFTS